MKKLLLSKKVLVSLVGVLVAILVSAGLVDPAQQDAVITAIVVLVASFNIGQGIADGLSKGATSANRGDK